MMSKAGSSPGLPFNWPPIHGLPRSIRTVPARWVAAILFQPPVTALTETRIELEVKYRGLRASRTTVLVIDPPVDRDIAQHDNSFALPAGHRVLSVERDRS